MPMKVGMDLRAVRAKEMRMKCRCGVVPALIGFHIRPTFAGPLGETVPTFFPFTPLSQDRPAVFAKATPGQEGSVPTFSAFSFAGPSLEGMDEPVIILKS